MKTIYFNNLVYAKNDNHGKAGETISIQVPDDFDDTQMKKAGERGAAFGKRIKAVADFHNLPPLNSEIK